MKQKRYIRPEHEDITEEMWDEIDRVLEKNMDYPGAVTQVLHQCQEIVGWLPRELMDYIAEVLNIPASEVFGIASSNPLFCLKPKDENVTKACTGTACFVQGIKEELGRLEVDKSHYFSDLIRNEACGKCPACKESLVQGFKEVLGRLEMDIAHSIMEFALDESCGKCPPCREGTERLLALLTKIKEGQGEEGDLDKLETLSHYIMENSMCRVGQSVPMPVLNSLKYLREEFEAHTSDKDKDVPVKKCRNQFQFKVDPETCTSCGLCYKVCPTDAISWKKKQPAQIDRDKCIKCMSCIDKCRFDAIY